MYYRKIKSGRWLFEIQKIGYPTKEEDMSLNKILILKKNFQDILLGYLTTQMILTHH